MPLQTIVLLGAIAGFTIYLGLPMARLKSITPGAKGFLSMLATGVLLFLLVDVTSKMLEPIQEGFAKASEPGTLWNGMFLLGLLVIGLLLGLVGIVLLGSRLHPKVRPNPAGSPEPHQELAPEALSLIIAIGIGAHNLSEGLAIGQAAASGALSLAWLLIVGFGLHNMTEGFGIAGPLTGKPVGWKFLGLLGLIGGGPTFVGTVLGVSFHSTELFVFCLAFAAGAILYVVLELMGAARRYPKMMVAWGLVVGFLLGLGTDLVLTVAGV
jgi:ZIP family zinc transporter